MEPGPEEQLPPFEQERLKRIRRNQEILAVLQVQEAADELAEDLQADEQEEQERKRRRFLPQTSGPRRRSARSSAQAAAQRLQELATDSDDGEDDNDSDTDRGAPRGKQQQIAGTPAAAARHAMPAEEEYSMSSDGSSSGEEVSYSAGTSDEDAAANVGSSKPAPRVQRRRSTQRRGVPIGESSPAVHSVNGAAAAGSNARLPSMPAVAPHKQSPAGAEEDEDWQLQLALQLSMCADDNAVGATMAQHAEHITTQSQTAGVAAAAGAAAAAAAGAAPSAVAAGQNSAAPQAPAPLPAAAGTSKAGKGGKKRPRKLTAAEKQLTNMSPDDVFDLFVMFEPGERGVVGKRSIARQMQQLGIPVPDDGMLRDMVKLCHEAHELQQAAAADHGAADGGVGGSGSGISLEQFTCLLKQLWPAEQPQPVSQQ